MFLSHEIFLLSFLQALPESCSQGHQRHCGSCCGYYANVSHQCLHQQRELLGLISPIQSGLQRGRRKKKLRAAPTLSSLHTSWMYNMVSHSLMTLLCLRLAKSLQSCQFCEPATFVSTSIFSQFSCDIRLRAPERSDKSTPRPPPLRPLGRPHGRRRTIGPAPPREYKWRRV